MSESPEQSVPFGAGVAQEGGGDDGHPPPLGDHHPKRTRVLLSCAPCRVSKLKCDRMVPCGNCLKKGRTDLCAYAPRPQKAAKPAKGMAARLKRLEGMLREMMEEDGAASTMSKFGEARAGGGAATAAPTTTPQVEDTSGVGSGGRVVMGPRSTTYVGATHFMAMLSDVEDLKSYFEYPDDADEDDDWRDGPPEGMSAEMLMVGGRSQRSKYDLVALLPPRAVVDRLLVRYFGSNTPSHYIVHRPTFSKQYSAFWQDTSQADMEWLGVLYGIMALGVHFAAISLPNDATQAVPWAQQFKRYRTAASWALGSSRFASPTLRTIQGMMLYTEAEFLVNRASQANCWLLSAVCIRLMLNMGLHRDPSKLPNISAFDGEMRRRMWNLAIQLDLIVSFHLGLPSMIHGIPSDTALPANLLDDDFGEATAVLPPSRPDAEYTDLSYLIFKSMVCRVFGQVARLSHALSPPTYAEVLRTDALLADKWRQVPPFIKVRPLADCVTDPPALIVQRFGVAALFQKSRCVLHRPYLVDPVPKPEHAYSRTSCLQAALKLLEYHEAIHDATQPGGLLHQIGWFVTGLGMHDFLLAAVIVYLVVENAALFEGELVTTHVDGSRPAFDVGAPTAASTSSWGTASTANTANTASGLDDGRTPITPLPVDRDALVDLLGRSYRIWAAVAHNYHEVKKAAELLDVMLSKIHARDARHASQPREQPPTGPTAGPAGPATGDAPLLSSLSLSGVDLPSATSYGPTLDAAAAVQLDPSADVQMDFLRRDLVPAFGAATNAAAGADATPNMFDSWIPLSLESLDWGMVDTGLRTSAVAQPEGWIDQAAMDDISYVATGLWDHPDPTL